jgi:hypothetical protein
MRTFITVYQRSLFAFAALCAIGLTAAPAVASGGPPLGKYACYAYGFGMTGYYNGVTVILEPGNRYTTQGASFTGTYRYVAAGNQVQFLTGKLAGLRSRYRSSASGHSIIIAFKNHNATNTAVCSKLH